MAPSLSHSNPANPFLCSYDWDGGEVSILGPYGEVIIALSCGFGWSQAGTKDVRWCVRSLVTKQLWPGRQRGAWRSTDGPI